MKSKEKREKYIKLTLKKIIYTSIFLLILCYVTIFYNQYFKRNQTYAKEIIVETETDVSSINENVEFSNANQTNIDTIIEENSKLGQIEEIIQEETVLEYLTDYRTNSEIPKGVSYVIQEGRKGTQKITKKRIYKDGELISEEQISAIVTKSSLTKIVEIGGANYTVNYKVKVGDTVYVTSDRLAVMTEPSEESTKVATLKTNDQLEVKQITDGWYYINCNNTIGWVKQECTTYQMPKQEETTQNSTNQTQTASTKQQLLSKLSFDMKLNQPSGLTLEQFKKILTDSKDKNKIFENNAEYFYYIEKQYQINGVFVAAVGIHESAWGTSQIALNKNNLFGYGAYDSNTYNGAYSFSNYAESIDLLARVFVKYYLNPKGTNIYGGEKAVGTYYTSSTLTGINNKYATDKNWANAVYTHMKYLYNKL